MNQYTELLCASHSFELKKKGTKKEHGMEMLNLCDWVKSGQQGSLWRQGDIKHSHFFFF